MTRTHWVFRWVGACGCGAIGTPSLQHATCRLLLTRSVLGFCFNCASRLASLASKVLTCSSQMQFETMSSGTVGRSLLPCSCICRWLAHGRSSSHQLRSALGSSASGKQQKRSITQRRVLKGQKFFRCLRLLGLSVAFDCIARGHSAEIARPYAAARQYGISYSGRSSHSGRSRHR